MPRHSPRPIDRKATARARKRPASSALTRMQPSRELTGCDDWPIVRAYLPPEDCWKSTGFGLAGLVRQQPDGRLASAFFSIGLTRGGLFNVFGHDDSSWEEIELDLRRQRHALPPTMVAPDATQLPRYVWGAYAWSLEDEMSWPPELEQRHLAFIPPTPGSRNRWLAEFAGPTGVVPADLYDLVKSIEPTLEFARDVSESLVFTEVTYAILDQARLVAKLKSFAPHITPMDQDLDTVYFECSREYSMRKAMPLEPMRQRQPVGTLRLQGGKLIAESRSLSLAAYLIGKLRECAGDEIAYERTVWSDFDAWLTGPDKDYPIAAY